MSSTVTVSNGVEFFRISSGDLQSASEDGFYRPIQRGLTIVGNDEHLFEIPLSDLNAAKSEGYRDLLESERKQLASAPTPLAAVATSADQPTSADQLDMSAVSGGELSTKTLTKATAMLGKFSAASRKSKWKRKKIGLNSEQELEEAEGMQWYMVYLRQWLAARRIFLETQLGSHGISLAIHAAVILLLASLVLVDEKRKDGLVLSASPASEEVIQDVIIEPVTGYHGPD